VAALAQLPRAGNACLGSQMPYTAWVPRIRLHYVRHSYTTICLDRGIDLKSSAAGSGMPP
jgi:site-specific recombinase XerD